MPSSSTNPGSAQPLHVPQGRLRQRFGSSGGQPVRRSTDTPLGPALLLLSALWFLLLFDPHWYLAAKGLSPVLKIPVLLFGGLLLAIAIGVPTNPERARRWQWYAPYSLYILVGVITLPFALNKGYAWETTQQLLLWWALIVGTAGLIDGVRRAEMLVTLYGLQFLWWAAWGAHTGLVGWHHSLSNDDGFGAFNVGGLGICYFLGLSSRNRWFKWLMYGTAGLCALGVVASFARGAFLALMLLFFVIWLRSPHKGKTAFAMIGAGMVVLLAASVMFEDGAFWAEMMTAFEEGTTEGTGEDRMILWSTAWRVFLERPLFGAGPKNFGVLASELFSHGELPSVYSNPGALYNMSLHSLYMTTLSELGIVGVGALIWILVDYWKRNAALRTPAAERRWQELGGRMKLRPIALGLEAAMVAFLANAAIYSMMGLHWFFTMLAINLTLHNLVIRKPPTPRSPRTPGRRRPVPASPTGPL